MSEISTILSLPNSKKNKTKTLKLHITVPSSSDQWPLLLTWFNFNPSMDK